MSELSPAAQAVLAAATQRLYGLDPEDVPLSAGELGCAIAAALRALAIRGEAVEIRTAPGMAEFDDVIRVSDILSIATELDPANSTRQEHYE